MGGEGEYPMWGFWQFGRLTALFLPFFMIIIPVLLFVRTLVTLVLCRLAVFVRGAHGCWAIVLHGVLRE